MLQDKSQVVKFIRDATQEEIDTFIEGDENYDVEVGQAVVNQFILSAGKKSFIISVKEARL